MLTGRRVSSRGTLRQHDYKTQSWQKKQSVHAISHHRKDRVLTVTLRSSRNSAQYKMNLLTVAYWPSTAPATGEKRRLRHPSRLRPPQGSLCKPTSRP